MKKKQVKIGILSLIIISATLINLVLIPFTQDRVREDFAAPTSIDLIPLPIGYYAEINHYYQDYGGCSVCLGFTPGYGTTKGYYVGSAGIYRFFQVSSANENPN